VNEVLAKISSLQLTLPSSSGDNATSLLRELAAINSTDVSAAASCADEVTALTDALDARRAAVDEAVRRAAAEYQLLADRLEALRAQLAAAITSSVGDRMADITRLRDDVRRTLDDARQKDWNAVELRVRSWIFEYQAWIDARKLRRDRLRAQLARMSALLAMFT